jgi:imidazolonepropionase-like amidohydrolase
VEPAAFAKLERGVGRIATGYQADMVLLDANPLTDIRNTRRIAGVVLRGKFLDRGALDSLLASARR